MFKLLLFIMISTGFFSHAGLQQNIKGKLVKKTATQIIVENNRDQMTINTKDIKSKRELASIKKAKKGSELNLSLPLKTKIIRDAKKLGAK